MLSFDCYEQSKLAVSWRKFVVDEKALPLLFFIIFAPVVYL